MGGAQFFNKMAAAGEIGSAEDKHDHNLVRGVAAADEDMAQKSFAGVLVVRRKAEFSGKFADGGEDFVGGFVLDGAAGDGYDPVRVFLVNAKLQATAGVGEGGVDLVAVMVGFLHADDGGNGAKAAEEFLGGSLFQRELVFVGGMLQAAAATAGKYGAEWISAVGRGGFEGGEFCGVARAVFAVNELDVGGLARQKPFDGEGGVVEFYGSTAGKVRFMAFDAVLFWHGNAPFLVESLLFCNTIIF